MLTKVLSHIIAQDPTCRLRSVFLGHAFALLYRGDKKKMISVTANRNYTKNNITFLSLNKSYKCKSETTTKLFFGLTTKRRATKIRSFIIRAMGNADVHI